MLLVVVNNGEMQAGPSSGTWCWERKHLVFWAEWAGLQVPLGWEGKGGIFPKQTLWFLAPQRLLQGWEEPRLSAFWVSECEEPSTSSVQGSRGAVLPQDCFWP